MKLLHALILLSFAFSVKAQEDDDTISIIINDWTSQVVMSHITGALFEMTGHKVRYSFSTTNQQWGSLMFGIDHVQVEVWQGTMSDMMERALATGRVVEAGTHDAKTREEWWYPLYVEALCPGLPDWRALNRCASLFAMDDSGTGIYIAGPWEKPEAARIRALKMNFNTLVVKHADELWQYLAKASQEKKPIVLFNWTPNWVEAVYPGRFVEFPAHNPKCESDPEWGINPNFHYDCGNPQNGWLKKAAWRGVKERWPCAFETLKRVNFNNSMIAELAAQVDHHGQTPLNAAKDWLANNKSVWQAWLPEQCQLSAVSATKP